MRAALVLVIASIAIPLAFLSPLIGLCAYCWLAYMRPQELAWGIDEYTFGLYTAVALFLGLFVRLRLAFFRRNAVTMLILALWAWWAVATATALDRPTAMTGLTQISTIFLICLVTTGLCSTKKSFSWVLAAIVGSLAFHSVKHGIYGIVHPGASMNQGIGGMMSGNNENAIAFCFALPMLVYAGLARRDWRRYAYLAAAGLTAAAVVFSNSRAGFLALVAAGLVMVWRTRARTVSLFVVAPLLVGLFFWLAPASYVERVGDMYTARQTDLSIIHRLNAWDVAATITAENPFTGIGPKNFLGQFRNFPHAFGMPTMEIHNTYLEYTVSAGLPALALYLLLVAAAFRACGRVQRDARGRHDPRLVWFLHISRGLQAAMVAFLVASTFGSLMHFDLMYHFCALAAALPVAYRHELDRLEQSDLADEFAAPATPVLSRYDARPALDGPVPGSIPDFAALPEPAEAGPEPEEAGAAQALEPEDDLLAILAAHAAQVRAARAGNGPVFAAEDAGGPEDRPAPYALIEGAPRWYRDADLQGRPDPIIVRPDLRPDLGAPAVRPPEEIGADLAPAEWYAKLPQLDPESWKTTPFSAEALSFGEWTDCDTLEDFPESLRLEELDELLAGNVEPAGDPGPERPGGSRFTDERATETVEAFRDPFDCDTVTDAPA